MAQHTEFVTPSDRLRRVLGEAKKNADLVSPADQQGFRSFVLTPSNFKQWRGDDIASAEALAQQIALFADSKKTGAEVEDIFYELLLKFGQELTTPVVTLDIEGTRVFSIHDNAMLFVLDGFSEAMIEPLVALKPREIIALDAVFAGSDQLKSNLELQCRDAGVRLSSI